VLIDLHTHSTISDGTELPYEVMERAAASGLSVVGLTDHDSCEGWEGAQRGAQANGITLIRGVEFTSEWQGISVHLLSYLNRPDFPPLIEEIAKVHQARIERARVMVDMVAEDYPITWDDVVAAAGPGVAIGRPHVADALVAAGVVGDRTTAFKEVLHNSSAYYVPHYATDTIKLIQLVRGAGGVPVFAHPGSIHRQRVVPDEAIEEMAEVGLAGLEIFHRDNSRPQRARLMELADRLGLLVTGSSDYHGIGKVNRLGEHYTSPEVLVAIIEQGFLEPVGAELVLDDA